MLSYIYKKIVIDFPKFTLFLLSAIIIFSLYHSKNFNLVASSDADAATAGSYIIELDGDDTLTKNATVQVQFMQSNGSSAATTTAGAMVATVHYNYV